MKKITELIKYRWHEYLLEILVIIIGIVLAFGLNSWNEQQKLKSEEHTVLKELHQEFRGNIEDLAIVLKSHEGNIRQINKTIGLLANQNPTQESSILIQEIRMAFFGKTYNPMFGVMNSLLYSDRIGLIQNDELKYSLARFPGLIDDYKEEEDLILKLVFDIVIPEILVLDPTSTPIDNIVINNALLLMNPTLQTTLIEGEGLKTEMNRIVDMIQYSME